MRHTPPSRLPVPSILTVACFGVMLSVACSSSGGNGGGSGGSGTGSGGTGVGAPTGPAVVASPVPPRAARTAAAPAVATPAAARTGPAPAVAPPAAARTAPAPAVAPPAAARTAPAAAVAPALPVWAAAAERARTPTRTRSTRTRRVTSATTTGASRERGIAITTAPIRPQLQRQRRQGHRRYSLERLVKRDVPERDDGHRQRQICRHRLQGQLRTSGQHRRARHLEREHASSASRSPWRPEPAARAAVAWFSISSIRRRRIWIRRPRMPRA